MQVVEDLARNEHRQPTPHLIRVVDDQILGDTSAVARCHFLGHDANGRPRVNQLAKQLLAMMVEYCVPRSRINEAREAFDLSGSPEAFSRLSMEAAQLFTSLENSGECGELLLYFLMEVYLGIPQILCKMSLKTSTEMHVHGTDGVHARVENDKLVLYWCESKLYSDASGAIRDCVDSLSPYLCDDGGGASNQDILLVRDNLDTGIDAIDDVLRRYFDDNDPLSSKREIRGACLVGFSHANYYDPGDGSGEVPADVLAQVDHWFDLVRKRLALRAVESFHIEVFCVPIPDVDELRSEFRSLFPSEGG